MVHKIMVAGHVTLDMTPSFPGTHRAKALNDIVKPGKLIDIGRMEFSLGGCVSNTGMALHKFGAEVILAAKIGHDNFGKIIVEKYRGLGLEPDFIISDQDDTSYSLVLAPPGCDRCFLHDAAANHNFSGADISDQLLRRAQYFHFGYPTLMRRFYNDHGRELKELYQRVKAYGLVSSLDMAAIDPVGESAKTDWLRVLKNTLPYVDFFMPSIEELCFMLEREKYEAWQQLAGHQDICRALSLENDVKPLAEKALQLGCRALLLKCGAAGLYLRTSDEDSMLEISEHFDGRGWGGLSRFEKSFVPDRILSATGAGDVAIAAFIYGLSTGLSPADCLSLAAGMGALCLTRYDTLSGLMSIKEVMAKIESGWEKQNVILR